MKKAYFNLILFFFLFCTFIFTPHIVQAQVAGRENPRQWRMAFERGKVMFRQKDFGNAFTSFNDAKRLKRTYFESLERNFIDLLSINEVRRMGDSLDWVERYINERHYAGAADALEELYYYIPRDTFNNSAKAALEAFGKLKDFPDAEKWIGEIYFVEGEWDLALAQFQKAHSLNQLNEEPDFSTDLLYKIAHIRRIRREYNEMERVLLSILKSDRLWTMSQDENPSGISRSFIRQAMTRTLTNKGPNQFILQYRYRNDESNEAHRLLGFYYYLSGRHRGRAHEHLMFSFLIQNTVIIEELRRLRFDYTFIDLDNLAVEINRNPQLSEYALKNEYYKTAYYLAVCLYAEGNTSSALELWGFLSRQIPAGEWRNRSIAQLRSPYLEPAVEMP